MNEDNQKASTRPIGIDAFNNLLDQLRTAKPNNRSEEDRYYAIVITDVEKAMAVFLMHCSEAVCLAYCTDDCCEDEDV